MECRIEECSSPIRSRALCGKHYMRLYRNGHPTAPKLRAKRPIADRLWEKAEIGSSSDCWIWTGSIDNYGYGMISIGSRRSSRAHRVAYELTVGPIPNGLVLDHICALPRCINPEHLEPVTNSENVRRQWARKKELQNS